MTSYDAIAKQSGISAMNVMTERWVGREGMAIGCALRSEQTIERVMTSILRFPGITEKLARGQ